MRLPRAQETARGGGFVLHLVQGESVQDDDPDTMVQPVPGLGHQLAQVGDLEVIRLAECHRKGGVAHLVTDPRQFQSRLLVQLQNAA